MDLARHDDEQLRSALAVVRHRLLDNAVSDHVIER
jgi:hypothetical protein